MSDRPFKLDRRAFLGAAGGAWVASMMKPAFGADDPRPPVTYPRATASDDRVQPDWDDPLTITVGPKKTAHINGTNDRAIQAAIDYTVNMGGGVVKILPGKFKLDNCIQLRSGAHLVGSGADSVLIKKPSHKCKIVEESDWNDQEITLAKNHGFKVGDGVYIQSKNPHTGGPINLYRTLVGRKGNRFKVDRALRESIWRSGKPTAAAMFPVIRGEFVNDCTIKDITIDGNRDNNEWHDGNYHAGIWMQDCQRIHIDNVEVRDFHGDGISWQICHDVVVENSRVRDCINKRGKACLGLHPGSGAQRPLMRNNTIDNCGYGIFFCWGVKYGLAEKNKITHCPKGISIGHRDTDNLVRDNDVSDSPEVGIVFRPERGRDYAAHRNTIENNRVTNTGNGKAAAVDFQGEVDKVKFIGNTLRETRSPANRIGIKIAKGVTDLQLENNTIEGFKTDILDLRK